MRLAPRRLGRLASLRGRALIATTLGLAVVAGLAVFDNFDEGRLVEAQARLEAVRQLDTDNRALSRAMTDADAALQAYDSAAASTTPGTREELLAEYLQASREASTAQDRIDREAAATGLIDQERPVRAAADAWQAWAHSTRAAADSRTLVAAQALATDRSLLAAFQSADLAFSQTVQEATAAAGAVQRQRGADHLRILYGGLLTEAMVVALLAIAVVNGLLSPIARLTRAAGKLAEGVPTHVPFVDRPDEVGSLARALAAWQQAASDIARVFDRSPLGMARLDARGVILEANPSLLRMLPGAHLAGQPYAGLLEAGEREEFARQLAALESGARETFALEARHRSQDRDAFWGSLTVAAVPATEGGGMSYALAMLEDVDLRKTQELELAHRAAHDPLTGLPNRALFRDRLEHALRAARRRRGRLSVLLLDLDRFKPVNDELGHHAGDALLQQLAIRMRACFREADTVARMGGDEFAVVLAEEDVEGAVAAARKLIEAVAAPFVVDGVSLSIGISVGIAAYPEDGTTGERLLRHADAAMYAAKRERLGYQLAGGGSRPAAL